MREPFVIAEVAQGYEGKTDIGMLLIKAAAAAGADAVKFQIIFADDVCVPHYIHYDLFKDLEMPTPDWARLRDYAAQLGIRFYGDIAGPRSLALAKELNMDGTKIHSTCFYETELLDFALESEMHVLLSIGGIDVGTVIERIDGTGMKQRGNAVIMHGFQAEPTPINSNNLARIPALRDLFGVDIGFMDHADGNGPHTVDLSAVALGLGVSVFEKHITLDRALELEDYVSGLAPTDFADYVGAMRSLASAIGTSEIKLSDDEAVYRDKVLKRVVARSALRVGHTVGAEDILLLRSTRPEGEFDPKHVIGRTLTESIEAYQPINESMLS